MNWFHATDPSEYPDSWDEDYEPHDTIEEQTGTDR